LFGKLTRCSATYTAQGPRNALSMSDEILSTAAQLHKNTFERRLESDFYFIDHVKLPINGVK